VSISAIDWKTYQKICAMSPAIGLRQGSFRAKSGKLALVMGQFGMEMGSTKNSSPRLT